jgi:hypothetical protein
MRVDGTPGNQTSLSLNPANANRSNTIDSLIASPSATSDQAVAAGQFQPTSDFLPLVGALSRIPQVRQEIVGEVANRLSGGDLATPQARQQTVESILGAGPGHD